MDLKQSENAVYYIYDYTPMKFLNTVPDEDYLQTKKIWSYKDGNIPAAAQYTKELAQAIAEIVKGHDEKVIALVAVPPSKVNSPSSVRDGIRNIRKWYRDGMLNDIFPALDDIQDYGCLLMRTQNVVTSHEGRRATEEEQKNSICCCLKELPSDGVLYVLIDDVTTTGLIMKICSEILQKHGVDQNKIVRLALAATRKDL